jgi:predicted N-formylglutamate amidohydrolase
VPRDAPRWEPTFLLLTCEHAGHEVPAGWRHLFKGHRAALHSHLGYDPGALEVAMRMATRLAAPLVFTRTTRLLVDANRSLGHPQLFGSLAGALDAAERERVIEEFHTPHRRSVETLVAAAVSTGRRVLHVGVHSFTDVLDGMIRELDVALLFDPARAAESSICARWSAALRGAAGDLRHRFNEPYRGVDDGLTTAMRAKFAAPAYAGVEVEIRQGMIRTARAKRRVADLLATTLAPLIGHEG